MITESSTPIRNIEIIEKQGINPKLKRTSTDSPDYKRLIESKKFRERHDTILERVKEILKYDKYARKNYLWLLILYYVKMDMIKIIVPLEDFQKANPPGAIERARRELYIRAKKGDPDLRWLLKDGEFLDKMEHMEELHHDLYHQIKKEINEENEESSNN